jgi:hypothetical protein
MGVGGQRHAPAALPPWKTLYPSYRRLVWPRGQSGRVRKIFPAPGLDPRTVQRVASRYTDWAVLLSKGCLLETTREDVFVAPSAYSSSHSGAGLATPVQADPFLRIHCALQWHRLMTEQDQYLRAGYIAFSS